MANETEEFFDLPLLVASKSDILTNESSIFTIASERINFEFVGMLVSDEDGNCSRNRTHFLRCSVCNELFSGGVTSKGVGGHLKRHISSLKHISNMKAAGLDVNHNNAEEAHKLDKPKGQQSNDMLKYIVPKLSSREVKGVTEAIAKLCLRSGKSFNFLSSDDFRSFVREVMSLTDKRFANKGVESQLPSRQTIQRSAHTMFQEMMSRVNEKIVPHVEDGIAIAIDYGVVRESHLALHVSFMEDANETWNMQVLPLAFRACLQPKTKEEIYRQVLEIVKPFGLDAAHLKQSFLVADGARNMVALGTDSSKFKDYVRCFNHSLNLVFERSFKPYGNCELSEEEECLISEAEKLLDSVRTVAFRMKLCRQLTGRYSIPNPGAATRWLSYYTTVCDMCDLLQEIDFDILNVIPPALALDIEELKNKQSELMTIVYLFRLLPERMKLFQSNYPTIHHVLPTVRKLRQDFHQSMLGLVPKDAKLNVSMLKAIARSSHYAVSHHQDQLAPIHYGSVMLNPRSKNMIAYTEAEKTLARKFIEEQLSHYSENNDVIPAAEPTVFDDFEDSMDMSTKDTELARYLSEVSSHEHNVVSYWPAKRTVFPNLYRLANLLFSVLPSEAVCERAFSKSSHLLDKTRSSLSLESIDFVVTASQLLDLNPELLP